MRKGVLCLLVFGSLFLVLPWANAQVGEADVAIGFGTAHDKSNGTGLDYNDLSSCSASSDAACSTNSSHLSGLMMGFSGDYMLKKRYGVGAEVSFQPAQQTYVNFNAISPGESIKSRLTFYDFNGIVRPVSTKRAALQFEGGLGGANLKFYDDISGSSIVGNVNSSEYLASSNHFQLHAAVSVPIYLKDGFFVRPQFDLHYVPNLSQQYNSDVVTQGMVYVGYSFGGR
jgi:hypothetical protein